MRRTAGLVVILSLAGCSSGGCTSTQNEPEASVQNTYDMRRSVPPPARTSWGQFDPANPSYFQQGAVAGTTPTPAPAAGYDPRLAARSYVPPAAPGSEPPPPINFGASTSAPASVSSGSTPLSPPMFSDRAMPPPSFELAHENAQPAAVPFEPTPKAQPPVASSPRMHPAPERMSDADLVVRAWPGQEPRDDSAPVPASPPAPTTRSRSSTEETTHSRAADEGPTEAPLLPENPATVRFVSNKRISLNYKLDNVGSSGVSSVDLWYTRDGRRWKKQAGRPQAKPPFIVEVSEEGLYGFTLVARNGMGIGKAPPQSGDQPQVWVAVDWTKPSVRLLGIEPGSDSKAGNLIIGWSASDKNLGPRPITLDYAEQAGGPWITIIANTENTGRYVWQVPSKTPGRLWIRVEACDLAGNVGWAESKDPVVLDLSPPTVSIVTVDSADP
jgi:hypothetical protein